MTNQMNGHAYRSGRRRWLASSTRLSFRLVTGGIEADIIRQSEAIVKAIEQKHDITIDPATVLVSDKDVEIEYPAPVAVEIVRAHVDAHIGWMVEEV